MPETSESLSRQTELLLNASFAIRSSQATNGHYDQGTRLAIRLLLPYATPDGNLRITAAIGEILEHHTPQSDAEGGRYFVEELYQGHFRFADSNDCDKHPNNCTGVVIDYPCGWT